MAARRSAFARGVDKSRAPGGSDDFSRDRVICVYLSPSIAKNFDVALRFLEDLFDPCCNPSESSHFEFLCIKKDYYKFEW